MPVYQSSAPAFINSHRLNKTITFAGTAGTGAVGTVTVFTSQGFVIIREIIAVIGGAGLTGGAGSTVALGVTGATTVFNAATLVSSLDGTAGGKFWFSGAVANVGARPAAQTNYLIGPNSPATVFITVAVTDVTAGSINFTAVWDTAEMFSGDVSSNFS